LRAEWGRGTKMALGYERQYLSFFNGIKHNKGYLLKHLRAHRLLNITDNIGHS